MGRDQVPLSYTPFGVKYKNMLFISLFNYTLKIQNLKNSRLSLDVKSNVIMQESKCLFILDYKYTNTYILILHVFYWHLNFIPYSFPKVLPFSPKGTLRGGTTSSHRNLYFGELPNFQISFCDGSIKMA